MLKSVLRIVVLGTVTISYLAGCFLDPYERWGNRAIVYMEKWEAIQTTPPKDYNGVWIWWWDKRRKAAEITYVNGKRNGEMRIWSRTGRLKEIRHYKDGKLHGELRAFYDNGKIYVVEHYQNGKKHGIFQDWDREGRKSPISYYIKGKLVSGKEYHEFMREGVVAQAVQHGQNDTVQRKKTANPVKVDDDSTPQDEKTAPQ